MELSIVTTLYDSAPYLNDFYNRISAAAHKITEDYEIILVNDGSRDDSLQIANALYEKDDKVKILDLSRNFGQHKAIMTGLKYSRGERVFLIDCDLEIRPEVLDEFYAQLTKSTADVVYGVQQTRNGRLFDRVSGHLFYIFFNLLSNERVPQNLTTVRLMSRRFVSALLDHREREIMIGGLWTLTGFEQIPLTVIKLAKGSSKYHLASKIRIFINAVTSFSNRPLVFVFCLGLLISLLSGVAALYLIIQAIRSGFLPGWPSIMVSIWLLGGLTIFSLGVIGIYLSKVYIETKQRPYTIIRRIYDQTVESEGSATVSTSTGLPNQFKMEI